MRMKNKEYGSDFHLIVDEVNHSSINSEWVRDDINLCFSGRAALRSIIIDGIKKYGWEDLFAPSYYCHEVYDFIKDLNIRIHFYSCNPFFNQIPSHIPDVQTSAILVVNYFGISTVNYSGIKNAFIIEDLTHDLSAIELSKAHYIFGSLRKILPLPVGGFVKTKLDLPPIPYNSFTEKIVQDKLEGMKLKDLYLKGQFKEKEVFRNYLINAEHEFEDINTFSSMPDTNKEILEKLNVSKIGETKRYNLIYIKNLISNNKVFEICDNEENSSFALILNFQNSELRDDLRNHLINHKVFPFVLWPNQVNSEDIELSEKLLFIHVDFRYNKTDMDYIAQVIKEFVENVKI